MTCYGSQELAAAFRVVRKNTIQIAQEIGEEHYGFIPAPSSRMVYQLLAHIALASSLQEQIHGIDRLGTLDTFDFPAFSQKIGEDEKAPRNKEKILALLTETGRHFALWLDSLSDDFLAERVTFASTGKSRFEMILGVKEHEMHHRGQLMLIERMLNIVPHLTRERQALQVSVKT